MDVRVTSTSPGDAVDFGLLKVHCRVRADHDDGLLRTMLKAAYLQFEEDSRRKVMQTTLEVQFSRFPRCGPIQLPFPPFVSLNSVQYLDADKTWQTLEGLTTRTGETFTYLNEPEDGWPDVYERGYGDEVKINITCGYGTNLPEDLKVSFMTLVLNWFEDRQVGDVPDGIKNLWGPYQTEPLVDAE